MVLRVHLHMQAVLIEFVGHVHKHVERVAREVRRAPAERHGRRGEPLEGPEVAVAVAVDCVVAFVLVDRQLVGLPFEGVFAAFDAVGERHEQLAAHAGGHVVGAEGHHYVVALPRQSAQSCALLGDDGGVITESDGILLARAGGKLGDSHRCILHCR